MAAPPPTSFSLSLDSTLQPLLLHHSSYHPTTSTTFPASPSQPSLFLHKSHPFNARLFRSFSPLPALPPATESSLGSPPGTGIFLDATGLERLQTLDKFLYTHDFDHGWLEIRPMEDEELDPTVQLLAESFAESMWMPARYVSLLAFLVKQYVMQRRLLVPHTATLVGFYTGRGGGDAQLACTAEVSFDAPGANASTPTPRPPIDCPYICNMTVNKPLRRRGIGWQLLKACEELISRMKTSRKVYLHCRVVDTGPYNMYKKAGYEVAKTDSFLIWLTLQRRKYLMSKELPIVHDNQSYT